MIAPAMIALIRDGETILYREPGGAALFHCNLIWGPEGLLSWLDHRERVDEFDCDSAAGAVIDFDAKAMLWYTECAAEPCPRSAQMIDALIGAAWPDVEIIYADGMSDLQIAAGRSMAESAANGTSLRTLDDDPLIDRCETLRDVGEAFAEFDPADEEEQYAWVTVLSADQTLHHRLIGEIPLEVIRDEGSPIDQLLELPAYEVPPERNVIEGILFDVPAKAIRIWGGRNIGVVATEMMRHWCGWRIEVIPADGYREHCRWSGPAGEPLSDAEALAPILPELLMGQSHDPAELLGAVGQSVKGCLAKVLTGLTALICFPFFVFALISGNWKSGAIAIGIIAAIVVLIFKWTEYRFRRGFQTRFGDQLEAARAAGPQGVVIGPLDAQQRRTELDALLRRAGLPEIEACRPYMNATLGGIGT